MKPGGVVGGTWRIKIRKGRQGGDGLGLEDVGLVWSGLEWIGVDWFGMVWSSVGVGVDGN